MEGRKNIWVNMSLLEERTQDCGLKMQEIKFSAPQ